MQHPDVRHSRGLTETTALLAREVQAPAVIVIMSAGDAPLSGVNYLKQRQTQLSQSDENPG